MKLTQYIQGEAASITSNLNCRDPKGKICSSDSIVPSISSVDSVKGHIGVSERPSGERLSISYPIEDSGFRKTRRLFTEVNWSIL